MIPHQVSFIELTVEKVESSKKKYAQKRRATKPNTFRSGLKILSTTHIK